MIHYYRDIIAANFTNTNLPIVLATGLGKNASMNNRVEWILPYFRLEMRSLGFDTIVGSGGSGFRELDAAAEIKLMLGAQSFVGDDLSSFTKYVIHMRRESGLPSYSVPHYKWQ